MGPPPPGPPEFHIGPAGGTETSALAEAMAVPEAEVAARLARGCRVMAARQGEEVAGYCWISTQWEHVGELARELALPPGESYVWDCATLPRFRGRGLYTSLLRQAAATLAGEGQRRVWIGASSTNQASNRTFTTVGFRPAVAVVSLRLAGRGLILRLRPARGADAAAVAAARRMLAGRR